MFLFLLLVLFLVRIWQKSENGLFEPFENNNNFVDDILYGLNEKLMEMVQEDNFISLPTDDWVQGEKYPSPDSDEKLVNIFKEFLRRASTKMGYKFNLMNIQEASSDTIAYGDGDKRISIRASIFDHNKLFTGEINVMLAKRGSSSGKWLLVNGSMYSLPRRELPPTTVQASEPERPLLFGFDTPSQQAKTKSAFFSSIEKDVLTQEHVDSVVEKLRAEESAPPEYLCFGGINPGAISKEDCEIGGGGFWDTPVLQSDDCPFFKANKNYPNARGGVKIFTGGYCEIPDGAQLLGYRRIMADPRFRPMCHNCIDPDDPSKRIKGRCCESQGSSPDYAFPGDYNERIEHKDKLARRGLDP
jgi:hypothetical protein